MNTNRLSDRMFNIAYWIAMPLIKITLNDQRKWLRVICFILTIFPLLPLYLLGMSFWMLAFVVFLYEEI